MDSNDDLPEHLKKQEEETKLEMQSRKEIEDDLHSNPRYKEFFKQYSDESIKSFITYYAGMKLMYLKNGERWVKSDEDTKLKYMNLAEDCLKEILQKKLFNLQCKWRAELIQLPGVEICTDFYVWEHNIFNCPFLESITENELNVYIDYLKTQDDDDDMMDLGWQDYDEIKEAYTSQDDNTDAIMPAWYEFYDSHYGTGTLLLLPDLRGEKEEFYADLAREAERKKWEQENKNVEKTVIKESFPYYLISTIEKFIRTFESPKMLKYHLAYHSSAREKDGWDDRMEDALFVLEDADEICPVEANHDYRKAIIKAADNYTKKRIIETLPGAFEQYLQQKEMGFSFSAGKDETWLKNTMKELIINGRILNNEPPDLNF